MEWAYVLLGLGVGMIGLSIVWGVDSEYNRKKHKGEIERRDRIIKILRTDIATSFWIGYLQNHNVIQLTHSERTRCEEFIAILGRKTEAKDG